jgi:hypothetical protein
LPDKYVNEAYQYSTYCTSYRKNTDLLTNLINHCWYVNGQGGTVGVGMNLKFSNGQTASVAAMGDFTVYRPKGGNEVVSPGTVVCGTNWFNDLFLQLVHFNGTVESSDFSGAANWKQLIKRTVITENPADDLLKSTYGAFWSDNSEFYANSADIRVNAGAKAEVPLWDNPGIRCMGVSRIYDSFKSYLVFKPAGDGIWVTLGYVDWGWRAKAAGVGGVVLWSHVKDPTYIDTDEFPGWSSVLYNTGVDE